MMTIQTSFSDFMAENALLSYLLFVISILVALRDIIGAQVYSKLMEWLGSRLQIQTRKIRDGLHTGNEI